MGHFHPHDVAGIERNKGPTAHCDYYTAISDCHIVKHAAIEQAGRDDMQTLARLGLIQQELR